MIQSTEKLYLLSFNSIFKVLWNQYADNKFSVNLTDLLTGCNWYGNILLSSIELYHGCYFRKTKPRWMPSCYLGATTSISTINDAILKHSDFLCRSAWQWELGTSKKLTGIPCLCNLTPIFKFPRSETSTFVFSHSLPLILGKSQRNPVSEFVLSFHGNQDSPWYYR